MVALALFATALVSGPAPASSQSFNPASCIAMTDSITRLYSAFFLRDPDDTGFQFWADEFSGGRRGLENMADFFANSDEFRALYDDLTNRQFVELVYRNVLNRQPDAEGLAFWTSRLDSGAMTRGTLMINFSESSEYVAITNTIPPLAGYFNWYPEGTTFACGTGVMGHATGGKSQLDVVAFHFPSVDPNGAPLTIFSNGGGRSRLVADDYIPFNHLYREQFPSSTVPPADEVINVVTGPQVLTYVVSYNGSPMLGFDQRGGQKPGERTRPSTAEFYDDIEGAVSVVETFWATNWSNHFPGNYDAPRVEGTYDGFGPAAPVCGNLRLPPLNAVYCPVGHYVAWDVNLLSFFYAVQGDGLVYLVVAHEWGHAIQARMPTNLVAQQRELQADCLGGAALAGAAVNAFTTDGNGGLIWEEGDIEEVLAALTAIADETPWSDSTSHGNAEERTTAFLAGSNGGVAACLPG